MKAIRVHEFGGPEVMRLEEVPDPQCGPGQVLVRVHAVGVNPVETYIRAGRGTVEINPRDAMSREAAILGMLIFNATERETASIHAAIGAGLENGTLRPVIGQQMSLGDAPRAHQMVMEAPASGKIVLVP